MRSPKRSLISRARSLSQGVAAMVAGGFGGAGWAAAAGLGGAGFGASAAALTGGLAGPTPGGGAACEPSGFCSSAIHSPMKEHYIYHPRETGVKYSYASQWQRISLM